MLRTARAGTSRGCVPAGRRPPGDHPQLPRGARRCWPSPTTCSPRSRSVRSGATRSATARAIVSRSTRVGRARPAPAPSASSWPTDRRPAGRGRRRRDRAAAGRRDVVRDRQTGVRAARRPGDIAILFRSRESHREFEPALEARGIPTYVYKGLGFFDADEIKDVVALLRYLAEPGRTCARRRFLRSRFVRLSDPALRLLAPGLGARRCSGRSRRPTAASLDDEDRAVLGAAARVARRVAAARRPRAARRAARPGPRRDRLRVRAAGPAPRAGAREPEEDARRSSAASRTAATRRSAAIADAPRPAVGGRRVERRRRRARRRQPDDRARRQGARVPGRVRREPRARHRRPAGDPIVVTSRRTPPERRSCRSTACWPRRTRRCARATARRPSACSTWRSRARAIGSTWRPSLTDGRLRAGAGSLAEVLPGPSSDAVRAGAGARRRSAQVAWAPAGRSPARLPGRAGPPAATAVCRGRRRRPRRRRAPDDFGAVSRRRPTVGRTTRHAVRSPARRAGQARSIRAVSRVGHAAIETAALAGTLVHRLFQRAGSTGRGARTADEVASQARRALPCRGARGRRRSGCALFDAVARRTWPSASGRMFGRFSARDAACSRSRSRWLDRTVPPGDARGSSRRDRLPGASTPDGRVRGAGFQDRRRRGGARRPGRPVRPCGARALPRLRSTGCSSTPTRPEDDVRAVGRAVAVAAPAKPFHRRRRLTG